MTKLTASQWVLHWVTSLQIYLWDVIERNYLQEFDISEVLLCRRCVDYIFGMFKSLIDA